jgi:hypothetical protein
MPSAFEFLGPPNRLGHKRIQDVSFHSSAPRMERKSCGGSSKPTTLAHRWSMSAFLAT